jgi:transglutaminase-like putative cysteine protease
MRRLKILHRTYYNFSGVVRLGPHRLLLRPREGHDLQIESSRLETTPPAAMRWARDEYDNSVAVATFDTPASQLVITSEVVVRHHDESPLDFLVEDYAVNYPFATEPQTAAVLQPFFSSHLCPADEEILGNWVKNFWRQGEPIQTYDLVRRLCSGINRTLSYRMREEPGVQTMGQTLARGTGSCRDFANLLMEAARYLGLAARFVTGYLNAPSLSGNFGATHAWTEVYLPGAGWKGFDPTIGEIASSKHIAVAIGRLPDAVPPVAGSFFGPLGADLYVGVWGSRNWHPELSRWRQCADLGIAELTLLHRLRDLPQLLQRIR